MKKECVQPRSSVCIGLVRELYVFEVGEPRCKRSVLLY
jgi:hypothetical protein